MVDGYPIPVLTMTTRHAYLLVLGHRSADRPARSVLGPVSTGVLAETRVPVALVHRP
jgi:nucleotide-binding universal stress UspA family protein